MPEPTPTLADIAEQIPAESLPAVTLPNHSRGIVLGHDQNGRFIEVGTRGVVVPYDPSTLVQLITDPAARASVLTDAFAGTRRTYLWQCRQAQQAEQNLADERNTRILRDLELRHFLTGLIDTGRLNRTEAEALLREQFAPLPQPHLRVTLAIEGTFDLQADCNRQQLTDIDDLLTADISHIRNVLDGGDDLHIAPASTGLRLRISRIERVSDQPDTEASAG